MRYLSSAPELDSFDLQKVVLLVTAEILKIQILCVEIQALAAVGSQAAGFTAGVLLTGTFQPPAWPGLPSTKLEWNWGALGTCKLLPQLFFPLGAP